MMDMEYTVQQGGGQILKSSKSIWFLVTACTKGSNVPIQNACIFLPDTPKHMQDELISQAKDRLKVELELHDAENQRLFDEYLQQGISRQEVYQILHNIRISREAL